MYNIICLTDPTNLHNSSGINTFIIHLQKYFLKQGYNFKIITNIDDENLNIMNKADLVIINDYQMLSELLKNNLITSKILYYTHIGDLFHLNLNEGNLDFPLNTNLEIIKLLQNNPNILIGTQTVQYKNYLMNIFKNNKIYTLYEPLIKNYKIINQKPKYDIIIISSFYPRKNFNDMLNFIEKYQHKTLILCAVSHELQKSIMKRKLSHLITVISNVNNNNIDYFIQQSKCLLHLSYVEVLPYALLEATRFIPCIININTKWGQSINEILNKHIYCIDNPQDVDLIEKTFQSMQTFNYNDKITFNNYNKYNQLVSDSWNSFLQTEIGEL